MTDRQLAAQVYHWWSRLQNLDYFIKEDWPEWKSHPDASDCLDELAAVVSALNDFLYVLIGQTGGQIMESSIAADD